MFCALRHAVAIGLPFALLTFLTFLWTPSFAEVIEYGLGKEEWLYFNILALPGLSIVYAFNSIVNAPQSCKWSPFTSARGIQGLSDSLHKFLSLVLIMCFFLGLYIAIRGMLFVSLLTLFLDADAVAAFTSTKLHKMARSVPAYLLVFLLFSLPMAPIHLILCILLVPWVDLLLEKISTLMPAQTHWSEVTVLADDFIALQSLTFFGTPGTVLDVRGASSFVKIQMICQLWDAGRIPIALGRDWPLLLMAAEVWNLVTKGFCAKPPTIAFLMWGCARTTSSWRESYMHLLPSARAL